MAVQVEHISGSKAGQIQNIEQAQITIGRDPSSVLAFDPNVDLDVSTNHAQISVDPSTGQMAIMDLQSSNGTFVNGNRVQGGPMPLPNGGVVELGAGGPKIRVTHVPDAPPAPVEEPPAEEPPPEPEKKKSKAGLIAGIVGGILLLALILGIYFYSQGQAHETARTAKTEVTVALEKAKKADAPVLTPDGYEKAAGLVLEGNEAMKAEDWETATSKYNSAKTELETLEKKARKQGELRARARDAEKEMMDARKRAEQAKAPKVVKPRFDRAAKAEKEARSLFADGKYEEAAEQYEEAQKLYEDAELVAKEQAERNRQFRQYEEAVALKEAEIKRLRAEQKKRDKKIRELETMLEEAKGDQEKLAEVQEKLEEAKAEEEEARKAEEKFQANFEKFKDSIVYVYTETYIQVGDKRYVLARGEGSGFFASEDGRIVTAKHVVYPWKYEPKAMGMVQKTRELDRKILTYVEAWASSTEGDKLVFTKTYDSETGNLFEKNAAEDVYETEPTETTIFFQGEDTRVAVQPHVSLYNDIALLKARGVEIKPAGIAQEANAVESGQKVMIMGVLVKPTEEGKRITLETFKGEVSAVNGLITVDTEPASTIRGGPILDAEGTIVGIYVGNGDDNLARCLKAGYINKMIQ